ncbi:DUF3945 domain-containing protein [Riemerella anatipestifer]|uniref:DUF3945 domain-containing protein n=1 Tax=Riemerella anatipestifer TaxID=34085 RepID=UPI002A878CC4|nr:DUF3945 domain-containing protein [Riemerella anatipestifer]
MANESTETNPQENTSVAEEQWTDLLLVYDQEEQQIRAVKGLDKDGQLETVPPVPAHEQDFMKVDPHGNILSNFFSNFLRQVKNPSHFSFFKIPIPNLLKVQLTPEDLQPYKIQPQEYQSLNQNTMEQTNEPQEVKDTQEVKNTTQEVNETPSQNTADEATQEQNYRYELDDIDWNTMNSLGLSKEYLEKRNLLEPLLKGYKTDRLVPISMNLGSAVTRFDARLSLRKDNEGKVSVAIHGIRKEPQLDYPFFGHEFTQEDKENLLKTGNMGRVVELTNVKTGEKIPSIISIDELTNEIVALRQEYIKIPDEIKGIKLNEEQKQTLMEGKPLFLEGMISNKGEPFNTNVQFNAEKRYVTFLFDENLTQKINTQPTFEEAPKELRGRKLTEEQYKVFSQGKPLYLEGLESKGTGKVYNGYFTYNQDTGKVKFTFQNPNKQQKEDKVTRQAKEINKKAKENKTTTTTTQTTTKTQKEATNKGVKTTTTTTKRTAKPKTPTKKATSGRKM